MISNNPDALQYNLCQNYAELDKLISARLQI